MLRKNRKKGFTLIELIIVIAIIAILAGLLVPSMIGYLDESQQTVCAANRRQIERGHQYITAFYPNATLEEVLLGNYPQFFSGELQACPSKGIYSVEDEHILCSIHGIAETDPEDEPEEPEEPVNPFGIGALVFTDPNGSSVYVSADWVDSVARALSNYGMQLSNGQVYMDTTGAYVIVRNPYLGTSDIGSDNVITLGEFNGQKNGMIKIDTSQTMLTAANYNVNQWTTAPKVGSLFHAADGSVYICAYESGKWTSYPGASGGVWIKLLGQ